MAKTKVVEREVLSAESVRLINEIWDHLELIWGRRPTPDELRNEVSFAGAIMDAYHLRQLLLKLQTEWRSRTQPAVGYQDPEPQSDSPEAY